MLRVPSSIVVLSCALFACTAGWGPDGGQDGHDEGFGGGGCSTPIVLAFDPNKRVAYVDGGANSSYFDLGQKNPDITTDWPTAATPWLARDINHNGKIDDGTELFGSDTLAPGGGRAANGFAALSALDTNGDGRIDEGDEAWGELSVWRDVNGDRVTDAGELESLAEAGIEWIDLYARASPKGESAGGQPLCTPRGDCEIEWASFGYIDSSNVERSGLAIDIDLMMFPKAQGGTGGAGGAGGFGGYGGSGGYGGDYGGYGGCPLGPDSCCD